MNCAIMQPTYLPWPGYFALISKVDNFVFLDDVQFERRSWQSRNYIINSGNKTLLSIPLKKSSQKTPLNKIIFSTNTDWRAEHLNLIFNSYRKSPYWRETSIFLEKIYNEQQLKINLSEFTKKIIYEITNILEINVKFYSSSNMQIIEKRSAYLSHICKSIGCDTYISPIGSKDYLEEDNFTNIHNINLIFHSFMSKKYNQFNSKSFINNLSVLDLLFNLGIAKSRSYILKGVNNEY